MSDLFTASTSPDHARVYKDELHDIVPSSEDMDRGSRIIDSHRLKISGYTGSKISKSSKFLNELSSSENVAFIKECKESRLILTNLGFRAKNRVDQKLSIFELPAGVSVIAGPSNSGKSLICEYLAKECNTGVLYFHEPDNRAILSVKAIIDYIEGFLRSDHDILIIDSFRFFAYNADSKASAISGGISSTLFTELTALSMISEQLKKRIIVVLNFVSENEKNRSTIANALIGSVNGVVMTEGVDGKSIRFSYQARTRQNMRREVLLEIELKNKENLISDNVDIFTSTEDEISLGQEIPSYHGSISDLVKMMKGNNNE